MIDPLQKNFLQCHHHVKPTALMSILYCSVLSMLFVAALYVLVPPHVRKLDRDHPTHIQRRVLATLAICLGAILTYPLIFCDDMHSDAPLFSFWRLMFHPSGTLGVWLHTAILYTGPIVETLCRVYEFRSQSIARGKTTESYPVELYRWLVETSFLPLMSPKTKEQQWKNIRNYVVAPWTEEIIFRGCMVPVLLASGMKPRQVSFVAPLFFGFAHLHHAALRLSEGESLFAVAIQTLFQFTYTSLFGSYGAYALIRSGSVMAVTMSHAYCNFMGLPNISFAQKGHFLYNYRILIGVAYMVGIGSFYWFFSSGLLLPLPSKLVVA
jgi:prenyl protein peptidase